MFNMQDVWKYRLPEERVDDYIKRRTNELYDMLPSDEEGRKSRKDIRDQIIELNYKFFGYVANQTFINNSYVTYDDKFQSACAAFMKMWYKYRWAPKYRSDLSFAVFFKLRIAEEMERELNEVKYSTRRALCMEAGAQLGKHWGQVKYEDIANVKLSPDKMNSLKAIFGSLYPSDIEDHINYMESDPMHIPIVDQLYSNDKYDDIPSLLIRELIDVERQLTQKDFKRMEDIYGIDEEDLRHHYAEALERLYNLLHESIDLN